MFNMDIWLSLICAGLAWAGLWSAGRLALQGARRGKK